MQCLSHCCQRPSTSYLHEDRVSNCWTIQRKWCSYILLQSFKTPFYNLTHLLKQFCSWFLCTRKSTHTKKKKVTHRKAGNTLPTHSIQHSYHLTQTQSVHSHTSVREKGFGLASLSTRRAIRDRTYRINTAADVDGHFRKPEQKADVLKSQRNWNH